MPRKSKKTGRRHTAAQKARILKAAAKQGLTGTQAAKKFGISMLTFYRWRGPVRSDALKRRRGKTRRVRPGKVTRVRVDGAAVRKSVQAQLRKILPQILREEIEAALR